MSSLKLPALIRSLRDGPPEQYDQDDLQVALWADGFTAAPAPPRHAQLSWFYDIFFKRPYPPNVMVATVEENRLGDLEIDLVSRRNRRYYEKLLIEAGCRIEPDGSPCSDSLTYLQGQAADEFLEQMDFSAAQMGELNGGWTVRFKISRDNFEHYFAWSNSLDMGY